MKSTNNEVIRVDPPCGFLAPKGPTSFNITRTTGDLEQVRFDFEFSEVKKRCENETEDAKAAFDSEALIGRLTMYGKIPVEPERKKGKPAKKVELVTKEEPGKKGESVKKEEPSKQN